MSLGVFSRASQVVFTVLLFILLSSKLCTAWSVDPDCEPFPQVLTSMASALRMASYAKSRAGNDPSRRGTSLQDLLGAPDENDLDTLSLVETWYEKVIDAATVPLIDGGVYIHCSDAFLITKDKTNRKYSDDTRGNNLQVDAPVPQAGTVPTDNACGGFIKAFTYSAGSRQVIILCSDSPAGALNSARTFNHLDEFRVAGNLKEMEIVKQKGIDALGMHLSTMLLHELMHAAGFAEQFKSLPAMVENQFPARLPDQVNNAPISEIYQFKLISGKELGSTSRTTQPSVNNLRHNADSFSLLAASWYLPIYGWTNGKCGVIGTERRAPDSYPDQPAVPEEDTFITVERPSPVKP